MSSVTREPELWIVFPSKFVPGKGLIRTGGDVEMPRDKVLAHNNSKPNRPFVRASRTEFEKPAEVQPVELHVLWSDFKIFENGQDEWIVACRKCRARWALARKPVHTGNVLSLMNHAASH